jgi:hypothetical protein
MRRRPSAAVGCNRRLAVEIRTSHGSLVVGDSLDVAFVCRLPDCKPVSVPLRAAVIPLGRTLLSGSSDLPGSQAGRAAPPPLFGLAPRGVFNAGGITPAAVRSYRTISPLPHLAARRYIFCGTFRRTLRFPRPLAGTLPYGDRTFLPRYRERPPVRQPHLNILALSGPTGVRGRTSYHAASVYSYF